MTKDLRFAILGLHGVSREAQTRSPIYAVFMEIEMAANIEVYTTDPCTFCLAAKNLLKKRGLEWTEHLVFGGTPEWDAMMARTGGKSVPQIVIDDEVIGGFPQLQAFDKEGKLSELA